MSLLHTSLSGAAFILAVVMIRAIAADKLPRTTLLVLWDIALLRLLLPVTFRFPFRADSAVSRSILVLDTLEKGIADFAAGVLQNRPDGVENGAVQAFQNSAQSIPVFLIIWAVGAAIAAGFFMVSYLSCRREFQTALPVQEDAALRWLHGHPLWRTLDIRQLAGLSTPLTCGIFRPVILMPGNTDWRDERQMQYILFHEYVHIRRFDAVGKLIASAVLCIHWFNPLVWVLYILFQRDIELSCDECVIRHFGGKNRKEYAMTLIRMEERKSSSAPFGSYFSKNATEERIKAIMKFRKTTIFTLIFAVIVVAAGAVAAFAMGSKAVNADFKDVLRGETPFLYVSEEAIESKTIYNVPELFDPDDAYMKIWAFAVLDLDGDGNTEVILSVNGAAGDMGGSLILHRRDGRIYGYTADYRALTDLKADGTYRYSDLAGMTEDGIGSIIDFTETGYTMDKITYGRGARWEFDTFVVNHRPAAEEEFWAAENEQAQKPDAVWYDFTDENIRSGF